MAKDSTKTTSYKLTPAEIEKMLLDAHGDKLKPVDDAQMARLRRQQAQYEDKQEKVQAPTNDQRSDDPNRS